MEYKCPVCGESLERELKIIIPHTEKHIIDIIKEKHPSWSEKDGTCNKCYLYYKNQLHLK